MRFEIVRIEVQVSGYRNFLDQPIIIWHVTFLPHQWEARLARRRVLHMDIKSYIWTKNLIYGRKIPYTDTKSYIWI